MSGSQVTKQTSQMKALAAWGALAFGGAGVFALATNAADEPAQQRTSQAAATEVAVIDGAEIFAREWIPGDARSHGGDGLGPVFNDSSCVACHNQGGVGGAGPASKNVDIVTAFHAPMNQQRGGNSVRIPTTLPGLVFQSVFGRLDSVPRQQATPDAADDEDAADPQGDPKEQLTAAARAAEQKKKQAELQKKLMKANRKQLAKLHPGFAFANSVVLHKDATYGGYQMWRSRVGGMQSGGLQQTAQVELFVPQNADAVRLKATPGAVPPNRNILMNQLKQEVQFGAMRGRNTSSRQGNFVVTKSQRNTTALFGAGLIDSISEETLVELEKSQTKNRLISGRVARLKDGTPGRFGWKAQKSSLSDFVLTACAVEVGLNVPKHPQAGLPQDPKYKPAGLDLNQAQCNALIGYIANLPAPAQRKFGDDTDKNYINGGHALFAKVGCADCHVEAVGEVAGIFSDLLLHDMGSELGDTGSYDVFIPDSTPDGELLLTGAQGAQKKITGATRQEWRTTPLWGVRDSAPYLHDGRAKTLAQAIAMHGGESATSTQKFFALSDAERFQVISFMKSLIAPTEAAAKTQKVASAR
jgi:CxxC motif-containing protein (DUF1111 family)